MELLEAPDPVEVSSFHFAQLRTLRLAKGNEKVTNHCVNAVATSSKYGLLFVGIENGFKVLKLENILDLDEDKENKSIEENYYSKVIPSDTPILISLSADEGTLAVCVNKNSSVIADMYDIAAFADPEETPVAFQNVLLSSNGSRIKDFIWNPVSINIYAFCMSDGSLAVHELSGTTLKIMANLPKAVATAISWSPKGKQIVVGKSNGSFSQYKPTLQEVKNIPPPTLDEKVTVANICWVSTTQFVILYAPEEKGLPPYLFVVSTPKGAAITYTNFYDVCLGNNSNKDQRYYLHFEPTWGITICASIDSIEVAVIGDAPKWVQWDVKEDGRALLPAKDGASNPIGMGIIYSAQRKIVISEIESYAPMPIIFLLTNNGLLVSYHMINTAATGSLVRPSTPIKQQGESKKPGHVQKVTAPNIPQQIITPVSNTAIIQAPLVTNSSVQGNKVNMFTAPVPPLIFGLNQNINPSCNVSSSGESIPLAPMGMTQTPVSTPKTVNSSLKEQVNTQTVSNKASFPPSAPTFGNETKSSVPSLQTTEPVVSKEEINKQNTYIAAIIEEVQTFEKELQELKTVSEKFTSIGTKEEKANLKASTLSFQDFQTEMSEETMSSLNSDIHNLKNALLESFVMVEEANSRERKKNDHFYLSLLKERALDPFTAKRMKKIEQNYLYLSSQLLEVNNKIDQDWYECLKKRKENQKLMSHLSSAEAIYRILVNNQDIIHNLRKNLNHINEVVNKKRQENMSKKNLRTQFTKKSTQEELSKLADTFLQTKITAEEEKSPKPKKISSEAQNVLRNYFSSVKVNVVRPTVIQSPSQSRLISKSGLFTEKKEKSSLQSSETQYDPPISAVENLNSGNKSLESENVQVGKYKDMKLGTVSKFTLTSMQSPSPKESSSPSVSSSSGGPFYEDITPPISPGLLKYPPETLSFLQELTSQNSFDEDKLNILLEIVRSYNALSQSELDGTSKQETENLQGNSSELQKEILKADTISPLKLETSADVTKKNTLSKPFSFTSTTQNILNSEYGSSSERDSVSIFPLSEVMSKQKSDVEKMTFTKNSQDGLTPASKLNIPSDQIVSSVSFIPALNKITSPFDYSDKTAGALINPKKLELVSSAIEISQTPISTFSTVLDTKAISQPPTLVFNLKSDVQSPSAKSDTVSTIISNKELISGTPLSSVASSENKTTSSTSFLFGTTSSEPKITSSSLSFEKPATDSKTGVSSQSDVPAIIPTVPFSQATFSISNTDSSISFLGTGTNPEDVKSSTSFMFGSKTTHPDEQKSETTAPDFNKNIIPVTSQITSLTSLVVVPSSDVSLSVSAPTSPVVEALSPPVSTSSTTIVVSLSSIQTPDSTTSSTTLSSTSVTPTSPSFGQQITNVQTISTSTTSLPSTTTSTLFGQDNKSGFSSQTNQSFFGVANNSQSSFFGKPSPVSGPTTKPTSFFGNTSLESTPTTQSFFGKPASETPVFGQTSVFGSLGTTKESTQSTGSFFSQPAAGSSVFGSSTNVNTSESSGFGTTSDGSFSFGKSPFGQTQGSFGLAKSVFGQSSTFGQPSSPQSNAGFGQSTGISSFGQGSFFSGLGGKPSDENASKNVFAIGNIGKSNTESSVFGSSGSLQFGAKTASFTPGGFSSGSGSVAQSGFGSFQQSPHKPGCFGAAPTFGGSPSFGSAPAFGSPPSFGSGNALSSVFGSPQQSSNFSNFATADSPTFGSLASQSPSFGSPQQQTGFGQQQGFGNTSVFGGGSAFGNQAPGFGSPSGGQPSSSAFTQWRN